MTGKAIANRRWVNLTLNLACILVAMARQAELHRGCGNELHPGGLLIDSYFMAAQTACLHGRVDSFALLLVAMTLQTFGGIHILVEGNRVDVREYRAGRGSEDEKNKKRPHQETKTLPTVRVLGLATGP